MAKTFFVTGTDTEVGKTYSSSVLLEAANAKGLTTLGLKPMAAGCEDVVLANGKTQLQNEDAQQLIKHSSLKLSYQEVNPVSLKVPASPHIAAALENRSVSASRMEGVCRGALMKKHDFSLVEGAGGWRVPISPRETMADLAKRLDFPVILVVGLRLGCLNHALLTAEAIRRDGLSVAGWVANSITPSPMSYEEENIATLRSALAANFLGHISYNAQKTPVSHCNEIDIERLVL